MIKMIIFDFGGVLSENISSWNSMYKGVKEATGLSAEELENIRLIYWEDISVNKISFTKFLKEVIKVSPNTLTIDQLLFMFAEETKIYHEVVDIIKALKKKGFRVVILANESKLGEEFRLKRAEPIVDKIYSSATLQLRKPNSEIFNLVLKMEHITSDEVLFIDDKERNTVVAEKLGIKSILYKNPKQLRLALMPYQK